MMTNINVMFLQLTTSQLSPTLRNKTIND